MGTDLAVELQPVVSPELTGINVGSRLGVGFGKHGHHAQEDFFYALHRRPSFLGPLIVVGVFARRVQNGDTDCSVGVHVGMQDGRIETKRGCTQRVVLGEIKHRWEHPVLVRCVCRAFQETFPPVQVVFGHRAGYNTIGSISGKLLELFKKPALGGGSWHE